MKRRVIQFSVPAGADLAAGMAAVFPAIGIRRVFAVAGLQNGCKYVRDKAKRIASIARADEKQILRMLISVRLIN
ncbi:hypothetical protein ALC62_11650 [Cyphomyrmex costatus]|uniref:Uncharacterized protein n=1 Tax=Cyphomyrmex costatus TaxID=456900 RepID=A0A151IC94_9HYME|nr:hypothetical protein ALC62_11650 [Cyphomyrmex costatus]